MEQQNKMKQAKHGGKKKENDLFCDLEVSFINKHALKLQYILAENCPL